MKEKTMEIKTVFIYVLTSFKICFIRDYRIVLNSWLLNIWIFGGGGLIALYLYHDGFIRARELENASIQPFVTSIIKIYLLIGMNILLAIWSKSLKDSLQEIKCVKK